MHIHRRYISSLQAYSGSPIFGIVLWPNRTSPGFFVARMLHERFVLNSIDRSLKLGTVRTSVS